MSMSMFMLLVGCAPSEEESAFVADDVPQVEAQEIHIDPSTIEVAPSRSCSVVVRLDSEDAVANDVTVGCDPQFAIEVPEGALVDGDLLEVYVAPGWSVPTVGACWVELANGQRGEVVVNLVVEG